MSTQSRPPSTVPDLQPDNIPQELRARAQWVLWRYEWRRCKWPKVPYAVNVDDRRLRANASDPSTWTSFHAVLEAARQPESGFDGIGYVFAEDDPYSGVDLDDCMDVDGKPTPEAQAILDLLDSYAEVSPSRRGLKIWVRASLPLPAGKTGRRTKDVGGMGELEMYHAARYFTVTGWAI